MTTPDTARAEIERLRATLAEVESLLENCRDDGFDIRMQQVSNANTHRVVSIYTAARRALDLLRAKKGTL